MTDKRSMIAQLIVEMSILEKREIKRKDMIDLIKEVNESQLIGHACRFVINSEQVITHIQKYRKTAVEKKIEKEKIERLTNGE
jgi:dTDP-D-glucose 4,6-dehydratase